MTGTLISTLPPGGVSGIGTRVGVAQRPLSAGRSARRRNRLRQATVPTLATAQVFTKRSPVPTTVPSGMVTSAMNALASPGTSAPAGVDAVPSAVAAGPGELAAAAECTAPDCVVRPKPPSQPNPALTEIQQITGTSAVAVAHNHARRRLAVAAVSPGGADAGRGAGAGGGTGADAGGRSSFCTASHSRRQSASSPPQTRTNSRTVGQLGSLAPRAASCSVVCEIAPESAAITRNDGSPASARSVRSFSANCRTPSLPRGAPSESTTAPPVHSRP